MKFFLGFLTGLALLTSSAWAAPGNTPYSLNFSGYLASSNGSAASGTYAMRFSLFLGVVPARVWCAEYTSVMVLNGNFAVVLGSSTQGGSGLDPTCTSSVPANLPLNPALVSGVDSSTPVQVEVDVSPDGGSTWETLSPNLPVSSAMFSLQSDNALSAENTSAIQGIAVSSTAPTLNQILQFNGTDWIPATVAGGGGTPAGVQGYIQYNSAGSFGASMNLFWDSTNNRLGVGNATPLTQIDVSGANTNGTFRVFDQSGSGNTREIIKAGASQAANLTEWQNGAGTVQASMSAAGSLTASSLKLPSGSGSITLQGISSGTVPITLNLPDSVGSANQVLTTDGVSTLSWASALSSGSTLNGSNITTGTVDVANGGTGDASLTLDGVLVGNGTSGIIATSAGSQYLPLVANASGSAPSFQALPLNQSAAVTGALGVSNGGTGAATLTANAALLGNGTSALQTVAAGTTGNYLRDNGTTWASSAIQSGDLPSGVLSGSGVLGYVPNYTSANVLGDSSIFVSGGSVGIGTTSVGAYLQINPTQTATTNTTMFKSGIVYNGGSSMTNWYGAYVSAPTGSGTITNKYALVTEAGAGNVGIGTTTPVAALDLGSTSATAGFLPPSAAGAAPITAGMEAFDTTVEQPVFGDGSVTHHIDPTRTISFQFGTPGGTAISTGMLGYFTVPFACTIKGWSIQVDAGTATVKTLAVASGTAIPTLGSNSISTSGLSISTGTVVQSTTVSDFTSTAIAKNEIVAADLTTTSGVGYINFQLICVE